VFVVNYIRNSNLEGNRVEKFSQNYGNKIEINMDLENNLYRFEVDGTCLSLAGRIYFWHF